MNDRPTATELLAASRQFLESALIPSLADARLKFQTLVAANVLAIVERELGSEQEHLQLECSWLAELLSLSKEPPANLDSLKEAVRQANEQLCSRIRGGDFDEPSRFATMAEQIREVVERKLRVANPRYLANFAATPR